jgi:hypothetical protein
MKKCTVCGIRSAVVPDRSRPGRPIKRVCKECHAERLREDLTLVLEGMARAIKDVEVPHAD